ncbi:hypothetical protein NKH37_15760 [Mesorhizobium sp. M1217]|uniref:hypothetical protein n=1 Tax=Mesorhizobium sp. M1217 TaxID=2957070 RepID=UPI003336B42C
MSRRWDLQRDRSRVARQGAEPVDGAMLPIGAPKRRIPKSEMRAEIDAAMAAPGATVSRLVACRCGHRATVRVPVAKLGRARFRCQCGELTS